MKKQAFLFVVAALALAFMVFHGNYDGNENWYSNNIYMTAHGKTPYVDFFYHRLPLFLYFFSFLKFLAQVDWISLRMFSALFYLASMGLFVLLLKRNASQGILLAGLALFATNLHAFYIYSSVQTYSTISFLLFLAVFLSSNRFHGVLSAVLIPLIFVSAQWMRYPIDYLPIAFLIYAGIAYFRSPQILLLSLSVFCSAHALLTWHFYSDPFVKDMSLGMFPHALLQGSVFEQTHPNANLAQWIRFKHEFLTDVLKWYLPFLLIGIPLLLNLVARKSGPLKERLQSVVQDRPLLLSLILFAGNTGMYLVASDGSAVQMYYVFPIMVYLFCRLLKKSSEMIGPAAYKLCSQFLVVSILASPLLPARYFRFDRDSTDVSIVKKISERVRTYCQPEEELFTFVPLLAMSSGMRLTSGLEFESYAYFENLDTREAEKLHLMNEERLMDALRSEKACAVLLDYRILNPTGNSARLLPIREKILKTVKERYALAEELQWDLPMPTEFGGKIEIYRRVHD